MNMRTKLARTIAARLEADFLSTIYGGTSRATPEPEALTLDVLKQAMAALHSIPPPPVFASSEEYPRDDFWTFERDGREYVIGHPDLWAKVPQETVNRNYAFPAFGSITIRDVDHPAEGELRAMVRFWKATASHVPGRAVTWPQAVDVTPSIRDRLRHA